MFHKLFYCCIAFGFGGGIGGLGSSRGDLKSKTLKWGRLAPACHYRRLDGQSLASHTLTTL
jgi:hypothetical protein